MSNYRQNYTPAPAPALKPIRPLVLSVLAVWTVIMVLAWVHLVADAGQPGIKLWPPAPQGIDPVLLTQLRVEAFRAGYAAGVEQGCNQHAPPAPHSLSRPL